MTTDIFNLNKGTTCLPQYLGSYTIKWINNVNSYFVSIPLLTLQNIYYSKSTLLNHYKQCQAAECYSIVFGYNGVAVLLYIIVSVLIVESMSIVLTHCFMNGYIKLYS